MTAYDVTITKANAATITKTVHAEDEKTAFDLFKGLLGNGDVFEAKTLVFAGFGDEYGDVYLPQNVLAGEVETDGTNLRAKLTRLGFANVKYRRKDARIYFDI